MAKRSRGPNRPGQRRPTQRPRPATSRPTPAPVAEPARPSNGLTEAEELRAAELEAAMLEQERAAETARRRGRDSRSAPDAEPIARGRPSGSLAVRYAHEYDYVRRDLRRIGLLAGTELLILFVLFFLIEVAGVIKI